MEPWKGLIVFNKAWQESDVCIKCNFGRSVECSRLMSAICLSVRNCAPPPAPWRLLVPPPAPLQLLLNPSNLVMVEENPPPLYLSFIICTPLKWWVVNHIFPICNFTLYIELLMWKRNWYIGFWSAQIYFTKK